MRTIDKLANDYKTGARVLRAISADDATWYRDCVPPKRFEGNAFVCGEPYTHNEEGRGIYLGVVYLGRQYWACYVSLAEWDDRQILKFPFEEKEKTYTVSLTGDQLNVLHDAFSQGAYSTEERASYEGVTPEQANLFVQGAQDMRELHAEIMRQLKDQ